MSEPSQRSGLERALGVFTEVRAGEGSTALLLTLNVFLLLTAYYVIKPVREALILVMPSGAEYKSYMSGVIAVALLFAVPAYARVASRLPRNRLVVGVTLFFTSHIVLFYVGSKVPAIEPRLGLVFYVWVGVFNMMVVAQFWAFANDLYTSEQGKRLFALIGLGASVGAAAGSKVAEALASSLGVYEMLLVAAAILAACAGITQVVHVAETRARAGEAAPAEAAPSPEAGAEPKGEGAFQAVLRHRYLTLLAAFALVFTFVNTNGEYMLGKLIGGDAFERAEASTTAAEVEAWRASPEAGEKLRLYYEGHRGDFQGQDLEAASPAIARKLTVKQRAGRLINEAYGGFFFWVNLLGVLLQSFVVSRLVRFGGLKIAFFVLPIIALGDAVAMLAVPLLAVLRVGKTLENATDYSLNNTLRNMLWLPTTREQKYQAKQAVDTFFVRMGDVGSALLVYLGAELLSWPVRAFAGANLVLVVIWLAIAVLIVRENARLTAEREGAAA
jgi:AAA family ATP:ADP antiporter